MGGLGGLGGRLLSPGAGRPQRLYPYIGSLPMGKL